MHPEAYWTEEEEWKRELGKHTDNKYAINDVACTIAHTYCKNTRTEREKDVIMDEVFVFQNNLPTATVSAAAVTLYRLVCFFDSLSIPFHFLDSLFFFFIFNSS